FSPNGDGVNDFFSLAYKLIDQFQIVIYDRWGNEVYTSNDPNFLWDGVSLQGGPSQEGTYVYVINGTTTDGSAVRLGGNVILIR
ncbi:MAG: gliding motility-associated C-terminal domain-containing protein, partial [Sphingobacteriia bacterium]|nr:gliding motility-associated C-terminal domain-containing protein [Sphingobacteriia bacterium]